MKLFRFFLIVAAFLQIITAVELEAAAKRKKGSDEKEEKDRKEEKRVSKKARKTYSGQDINDPQCKTVKEWVKHFDDHITHPDFDFSKNYTFLLETGPQSAPNAVLFQLRSRAASIVESLSHLNRNDTEFKESIDKLPENWLKMEVRLQYYKEHKHFIDGNQNTIGAIKRIKNLRIANSSVDLSEQKIAVPLRGIVDLLIVRNAKHPIKELKLIGNQLTGTIPESIKYLKKLTSLNLNHNQLKGKMPAGIYKLENLVTLLLNNNKISGEVWESIGNLKNLTELDLSFNEFNGEIPRNIYTMTQLTRLSLDHNGFEGGISVGINRLKSLTSLQLSHNNLSGIIPHFIRELQHLQKLDLAYNKLDGEIPTVLGDLKNLEHLDLSHNRLSGKIPPSIFGLGGLVFLSLSDNRLIGEISDDICALKKLGLLHLSNNELEGRIPLNIGVLNELTELCLDSNHLKGEIPRGVCNLTKLTKLLLNNNWLTGIIPIEVNNLDLIKIFKINNNKLDGELPLAIVDLYNLEELALANNKFTGSIPVNFCNLNKLRVFNYYNNNFTINHDDKTLSRFLKKFDKQQVPVRDQEVKREAKEEKSDIKAESLDVELLDDDKKLVAYDGKEIKQPTIEVIFKKDEKNDRCISVVLPHAHARHCGILKVIVDDCKENRVDYAKENKELVLSDTAAFALEKMLAYISNTHHVDKRRIAVQLAEEINEHYNYLPTADLGNIVRIAHYLSAPVLLTACARSFAKRKAAEAMDYKIALARRVGCLAVGINHKEYIKQSLPADFSDDLKAFILDEQYLSELKPQSYERHLFKKYDQCIQEFITRLTDPSFNFAEAWELLPTNEIKGNVIGAVRREAEKTVKDLVNEKVDSDDKDFKSFFESLPETMGKLYMRETYFNIRNRMIDDTDVKTYFEKTRINSDIIDLTKVSLAIPLRVIIDFLVTRRDTIHPVKQLILNDCQLSGEIPASISCLRELEILEIANNKLNGVIPETIGGLNGLTKLNLDSNQLHGKISTSIGRLKNLIVLWLSSNRLSGEITLISDLKNLTGLDLSRNLLRGKIPVNIGDLKSLVWLDLSSNQLSGEIPKSIRELKDFKALYLQNNLLTGKVPKDSIRALKNLAELDVSNNRLLSVELYPDTLQQLGDKAWLLPQHNDYVSQCLDSLGDQKFDFAGVLATLPPDPDVYQTLSSVLEDRADDMVDKYSNLTELLTYFDSLPEGIWKMYIRKSYFDKKNSRVDSVAIETIFDCIRTSGDTIDLKNINIELPLQVIIEMAALRNQCLQPHIKKLLLSNSSLKGAIPESIGSLTSLTDLYLDDNQLTGKIENIGKLKNLKKLNLAYNLLRDVKLPANIIKQLECDPGLHLQASATILRRLKAEHNFNFAQSFISLDQERRNEVLVAMEKEAKSIIHDRNVFDRLPESIFKMEVRRQYCDEFYNTFDMHGEIDEIDSNTIIGRIWQHAGDVVDLHDMKIAMPFHVIVDLLVVRNAKYPIKELYLRNNMLSGPIPESISYLQDLEVLDLRNNRLTGTIPTSIGKLKKFKVLGLPQNELSGSIPDSVNELKSLNYFDVSENQLTSTKISDALKARLKDNFRCSGQRQKE